MTETYTPAARAMMTALADEACARWTASMEYDATMAADYRAHVEERLAATAADCLRMTGEVLESALRDDLRMGGYVD